VRGGAGRLRVAAVPQELDAHALGVGHCCRGRVSEGRRAGSGSERRRTVLVPRVGLHVGEEGRVGRDDVLHEARECFESADALTSLDREGRGTDRRVDVKGLLRRPALLVVPLADVRAVLERERVVLVPRVLLCDVGESVTVGSLEEEDEGRTMNAMSSGLSACSKYVTE